LRESVVRRYSFASGRIVCVMLYRDEQKCSFVDVGRREMFEERDFIVSLSRVTQEKQIQSFSASLLKLPHTSKICGRQHAWQISA
jgi:hypothetical protein